jgi:hypothetical protein
MIRVIYGDIESVLKVNGGLSAPFKVCRGTRQGCSLSGMLYVIAIEPLLNSIKVALKECTVLFRGYSSYSSLCLCLLCSYFSEKPSGGR